jgi:hypothetical protein
MKKTVANKIKQKINNGEIKMRSRLSIWFEKIGIDGSITLILVSLIIIAGLISYWANNNNDLLFAGYGRYGLLSFIKSFPYPLLVTFIFLFALLTFLFRKFDASYKKPFAIIISLILSLILLFGWFSSKQNFGKKLYQSQGRMFGIGMANNQNSVSGTVIELQKNLIILKTNDSKKILIVIDSNTHFPFGQPKIGDQIRSVGNWENNIFKAIGVRVFENNNSNSIRARGQGRGVTKNQ